MNTTDSTSLSHSTVFYSDIKKHMLHKLGTKAAKTSQIRYSHFVLSNEGYKSNRHKKNSHNVQPSLQWAHRKQTQRFDERSHAHSHHGALSLQEIISSTNVTHVTGQHARSSCSVTKSLRPAQCESVQQKVSRRVQGKGTGGGPAHNRHQTCACFSIQPRLPCCEEEGLEMWNGRVSCKFSSMPKLRKDNEDKSISSLWARR